MGYCSASDVEGLCPNLLGDESRFSESTVPTREAVERYITSGCSVIETQLTSWGYDVPPAATATIYQWLKDLNTLYAAARAELTRANVTLSPGERTRGQVFDRMFWDDLGRLDSQDLSTVGLSRSSTGKMYVGGVSKDDKATWEDDSDRVEPRFFKGQFNFPGTLQPGAGTSAS